MRDKSIILYLFLLLVLFVSISAISAANVDNTTTDTSIDQQETVERTQDTFTSNPTYKTDTKMKIKVIFRQIRRMIKQYKMKKEQ